MERKRKKNVSADKYKRERKTKRTPVQGCTRRILSYKNVRKTLKGEGFISTICCFLPIKYGAILHIVLGCVLTVRARARYLSCLHFLTAERYAKQRLLKQNLLKKNITAVFRKRVSAKPPFFWALSR